MLASDYGWTDVVRELIAADGSVEHLKMKDERGRRTALYFARNVEIQALLEAAEAAADPNVDVFDAQVVGKERNETKGRCICM